MRTIFTVAAIGALLLTGCSSTQSSPSVVVHEEPALPDNCLELTNGAKTKLAGKIADRISGSEVKRTGLVASTNSDMWFLAVEFTDPGLEKDFTGIWGSLQDLTTDEDPAFVAVDEVSEASAEYLQPVDFDKVGINLDGSSEAEACLA